MAIFQERVMIRFKLIEFEDKELLTSCLLAGENRDCNLSFVNLCSWRFVMESSYALVEGCLVIRFTLGEGRVVYLVAEGAGDARRAVERLGEQARAEGQPLRLYGVFPRLGEWLEEAFPGRFAYERNRDYFDYLYHRQELVELKGKYLQPKRNHVNKFKRLYPDYRYTPLTAEWVPRCLALEEEWCVTHGCADSNGLRFERQALTFALQHLQELEVRGGVLWVGEEIVAFTYGAPVTRDTFVVHVEKADTRVEGAYAMINREFAATLPEQYLYVNREDDLGVPGLRQAKLSYHPALLLEKGCAVLQPGKEV